MLLPEVLAEVHDRLRDGATVTDLAAWLSERGHAVSRSAVGRYVRRWREREAERVETLELAAIVGDLARNADRPVMDMAGELARNVVVVAAALSERAAADAWAMPAAPEPTAAEHRADRALALAGALVRLVLQAENAEAMARTRRETDAKRRLDRQGGGATPETLAALRRAVGLPAEPPGQTVPA